MAHGVRAPYYNIVSTNTNDDTEYLALVTYHNSETDAESLHWTTWKDQAYKFATFTAVATFIEDKELIDDFLKDKIMIVEFTL